MHRLKSKGKWAGILVVVSLSCVESTPTASPPDANATDQPVERDATSSDIVTPPTDIVSIGTDAQKLPDTAVDAHISTDVAPTDSPSFLDGGLFFDGSSDAAVDSGAPLDVPTTPSDTSVVLADTGVRDAQASADACIPALVTTTHSYSGNLTTVTIGAGFNPLTASLATRSCLAPTSTTPTCTAGTRTFRMQFIQNSSELKSSLRLSASASYDSGVWGAEASASFFRSSEIRSDSAYLLLDVEATFGAEVLTSPRLSPEAIARLSNDPAGFVAACGTEYVSSITRGGFFRAIYIFESLSTRERTELAASFSAGSLDWTAMGSLQSTLEATTRRHQTQLFVTQSGGTMAPVDLTPRALIETARRFGASGDDGGTGTINCSNATPIAVRTSPYYTAEGVPIGARYPDLTAQLNELDGMASSYDRVRVLNNDLRARLARPGRLATLPCAADAAQFSGLQSSINAYLAAAMTKRDACTEINACGASPICLAPLPMAPTALPRLMDPARCGPACTDGAMSTYESDDYGYCTRCTWTWPSAASTTFDNVPLMSSECRYMRPGAQVTIQSRGRVGPRCGTRMQGDLILRARSGATANDCADAPGGGPCRWPFDVDTGGGGVSSPLLRSSIEVNSQSLPTSVTGYLFQFQGGGSGCPGLNYGSFVLDLCDADRPGGCALP